MLSIQDTWHLQILQLFELELGDVGVAGTALGPVLHWKESWER